jgi:hypothetical protein
LFEDELMSVSEGERERGEYQQKLQSKITEIVPVVLLGAVIKCLRYCDFMLSITNSDSGGRSVACRIKATEFITNSNLIN